MQITTPTSLAAELIAAAPALTDSEQRIAIALYRLLAEGKPVHASGLAGRAGVDRDDVDRALEEWRGIFTDDHHQVIGFVGLSIRPMPHRMTIAGGTLYAWCAYDTLFLPELIGAPAEVESRCPTTGEPIALTVDGSEVTRVDPPTTVFSYLHWDEPLDQSVINTFCRFIHFFADSAAADEWTGRHEGTFALSLAEGSEIARHVNRGRYPGIFTD